MKNVKCAIIAVLVLALVLALAGCNMGIVDTKLKFDRAVISMPDGTVIDSKIDKWWNYESSDMVQVEIDGTVYLAHSSNVVLIRSEDGEGET